MRIEKTIHAWECANQKCIKPNEIKPRISVPTFQAHCANYQLWGLTGHRVLAHWGAGGVLADDHGAYGKNLTSFWLSYCRGKHGPSCSGLH